jgi:hypothetical protein
MLHRNRETMIRQRTMHQCVTWAPRGIWLVMRQGTADVAALIAMFEVRAMLIDPRLARRCCHSLPNCMISSAVLLYLIDEFSAGIGRTPLT